MFKLITGGNEFCACCLPFRADFYKGCPYDCLYCYAKHLYRIRGHEQEFHSVKPVTTSEKLVHRFELALDKKRRGRINDMMRHKLPFRCGVMTDNFQPIEKKYGLTLTFLELLWEYEYPAVFNTKSDLVAEEKYVELFAKLAGKENVVVQMTLPTLDCDISKRLEPKAPKPERRLEVLKTLSERGVPTQIRLSPYIPEVSDDYVDLVNEAKNAGVKSIITEFLRIPPGVARQELNQAVGKDIWSYYESQGGKFERGYMRYPVEKKNEFYRKLKRIVEEQDMYLFVCSEEDPSINDKPVECANCCGTDFYKGFSNYNTATFNNLYKLLLERGEVTLEDMQANFYSPHWQKFEKAWNSGYFQDILLNVKKDKDNLGNVVYKYSR